MIVIGEEVKPECKRELKLQNDWNTKLSQRIIIKKP